MFEKSKTLKKLAVLMDENKFEEFRLAYQSCGFDITNHRPWFFGMDVRDLLGSAMLNNKPDFSGFLLEKIDAKEIPDIHAEYDDDKDDETYRVSMLYMAITNNMVPLALQLINTPGIDLDQGKEIEKTRYNASRKTTEHYWDDVESPFDLAGRLGNKEIIETLYNKKIERIQKHARDVAQNGFFFPGTRAKWDKEEAASLEKKRDELLGRAPKSEPPSGVPDDLKFKPN